MAQQTITKPKQRNSNLELLRIVCMILIICHHYAVHGGFSGWEGWSWNRSWVGVFAAGGKLGVNCFVLISGYFLCNQESHRWKSLWKLVLEICVFNAVWYGLAIVLGLDSLHFEGVLRLFMVPLRGGWWFATTYLVLMVFAPWMSRALKTMSRREHLFAIGMMALLWSVFPSLGLGTVEGSNLAWFVFLYVIAAYLRWYPDALVYNRKVSGILVCSLTLLMLLKCAVIGLPDTGMVWLVRRLVDFDMIHVGMLALSVALFCWCSSLPPFFSKKINTLAGAMFGVYLIHDSRYRWVFWKLLFQNARFQDSPLLLVHGLASVLSVFVICTCISLLYNWLVSPWIQKGLDAVEQYIKHHSRML